jgi:hypothetical protein
MTYLIATLGLFASQFLVAQAMATLPNRLPPGDYTARKTPYDMKISKDRRLEFREDALARAHVWRKPSVDIERANLFESEMAADGFRYEDELACKWAPSIEMNGFTAKFLCTLPSGETIKIKYAKKGKSNPEIQGEVVSSRLMRAIGFGADRMYLVKRVRCFGCPNDPWALTTQMHSSIDQVRKDFYLRYGTQDRNGNYVFEPDYGQFTDFDNVAIERRMENQRIEGKDDQGWGYTELSKIDARRGGSVRAEVDALKLMSSFIQHSDNKPDNQVLVCLDPVIRSETCESPFAAPQDLGSTFGSGWHRTSHNKFDVEEWASTPIWKSASGCEASLKTSPTGEFEGNVSEDGRQFLASLLNRLSDQQIRDLFNGVRLNEYNKEGPSRDVELWLRAFKAKRNEINSRKCGG